MTQDELKTLVGRAALDYVKPGSIVGVGTGSTVDKFIDALGEALKADPQRVAGAVFQLGAQHAAPGSAGHSGPASRYRDLAGRLHRRCRRDRPRAAT